MQHSKANIRYARALYNLANEHGQNEHVYEQMCILADFFAEAKEVRAWMSSPVIPVQHKKKTIAALFGGQIDGLSIRFLNLIIEKHRSADVYGIVHDYVNLYRSKKNIARAVVGTPTPLTEAEKQAFEHWFKENVSAQEVEMTNKVVPSLLGGFTLRVGWQFVDCSVAGRLHKLRRELKAGVLSLV